MIRIHSLASMALILGVSVSAMAGAEQAADIKDYLVDVGAGHLAANEIIGLAGSAVSNLQTPKDFVAAINALGDSSSKGGIGFAFTPGRAGFKPMGVPVKDYADANKPFARLWGSTTFSYAQNIKTLSGVDYQQRGAAINVSYYLNIADDPLVASFRSLGGDDACQRQMERMGDLSTALMNKRKLESGSTVLSAEQMDQVRAEVKVEFASLLPSMIADAKLNARNPKEAATAKEELADLSACAKKAADTSKGKWNASHLDLVLGQGWIKGPAATDSRLSLGNHFALALAYSPSELSRSLLNLTLRRVSRELDLDTIAKTPSFKQTSIAAARYTYGYGDKSDTFALAEISNAKSGTNTLSNAAFKTAIGIDRKINGGMWIELRFGRSRTADGTGTENKALFNLKFSPESTLGAGAGG